MKRTDVQSRLPAPGRSAPPPATAEGLSDAAMARVQAFVDAHLAMPISLQHLAEQACISRFHFARVFRARTGLSPMQYLKLQRIEAAKRLLRQPAPCLSRIATTLGFFDQSHFTRVFRRATGQSPGRFAAGDCLCTPTLYPALRFAARRRRRVASRVDAHTARASNPSARAACIV
ncbi:AraC family transcriptional regulator [Lysobacter firmicutimachus]|uniref:AraC family transcriptional regulator n=1 Tax=Lysobacter firmicutimachus TaxID=1792846 RepID=A0AAU8MVC5_9GAMM|nr:AraC family transcriptional regulator [Lysobacter antibioticus]